jgi:hypothetical protein
MKNIIQVSLAALCLVTRGSGTACSRYFCSLIRMLLLCFVLTGCKTFSYTEADMEREGRQISGFGTEPCPNGCWHEAHGFGSSNGAGVRIDPLRMGPITLPPRAFGTGL